jgi:hypothetical protein
LIKTLQEHQLANISAYNIIQPGIEKLENYQAAIADVPAYTLATCEFLIFLIVYFNNYYSA